MFSNNIPKIRDIVDERTNQHTHMTKYILDDTSNTGKEGMLRQEIYGEQNNSIYNGIIQKGNNGKGNWLGKFQSSKVKTLTRWRHISTNVRNSDK